MRWCRGPVDPGDAWGRTHFTLFALFKATAALLMTLIVVQGGCHGVRPGVATDAATGDAGPSPDAETIDPDGGVDAQVHYCGESRCPDLATGSHSHWFQSNLFHCCTPAGNCGVGNIFYFGDECFDYNQPGIRSVDCPADDFVLVPSADEPVGMQSSAGCCRPDGLCGFETTDYLGAGCVERNRFGVALSNGTDGYNQDAYFELLECSFAQRR